MVSIQEANDLDVVRELWREYWAEQGLAAEFQGFAAELAGLPGEYSRLLVAWKDGAAAGTIALRPMDGERAEAKRLYVRPAFRGMGIAAALLDALTADARAAGYRALYADTLPSMQAALGWYRRIGFAEVEAYSATPTPGAVYLMMDLTRTDERRSTC